MPRWPDFLPATPGTNETVRPTQAGQVGAALFLSGKLPFQLQKRSRVFLNHPLPLQLGVTAVNRIAPLFKFI